MARELGGGEAALGTLTFAAAAFAWCDFSTALSAATMIKPCNAASATKKMAAGVLMPVRARPSSGKVRGSAAGLVPVAGRRLVLIGSSPGGGRRLGPTAVGIEGEIGEGSESAMFSATSIVAMTLVCAG